MAVSEPEKQALFLALEDAIGKKPTETFMNLVTGVPWSEVATKSDLAGLRSDFADSRAEIQKALRGQLLAFSTVVALFNGIIFAVLKLTGLPS